MSLRPPGAGAAALPPPLIVPELKPVEFGTKTRRDIPER